MKEWQLTGPDPATSRSIADRSAAEPRSPPTFTEDALCTCILKRGMDQWMLAATLDQLLNSILREPDSHAE